MTRHGVRLQQVDADRSLIDDLADEHGTRAGLEGVLADLNRQAAPMHARPPAAAYGFGWDRRDNTNQEWWPQGITTSSDQSDSEDVAGRRLVVTSWYAKPVRGRPSRGTRLSFVDITDEQSPRYRHVLLVQADRRLLTRRVGLEPVRVHAGGIVWYGPSIWVADTRGGIRVFDVDDILRVGGDGHDGYRYVLPERARYQAVSDEGVAPFRFSFVSLDRTGAEHQLIAGEYATTASGASTRLVRFPLDSQAWSPRMESGYANPSELLVDAGRGHMQGATIVGGTYYISTSRGRFRRGSLWVRRPGERLHEYRGALSAGCEDLTYWPQRDQLWSLGEYPGRRDVYALPRGRFA